MLIYLITNTQNGKHYIGQTTCTIEKRWQEHIYNAQGNRQRSMYPLYHAIRKYGKHQFCIAVLAESSSQNEINELEQDFIAAYNTLDKNFGYNRHKGGNKPPLSTPESRRKAGLAIKGKPFSEEHCQNISKALAGRKLSPERIQKMKGRIVSEETRQKMSNSGGWRRELKSSPEHIEKIRIANTGKKHSEETKQKISASKINPSKETRRRLRESHLGKPWTEKQCLSRLMKTIAWG
jgi:group I intron endonuclease